MKSNLIYSTNLNKQHTVKFRTTIMLPALKQVIKVMKVKMINKNKFLKT